MDGGIKQEDDGTDKVKLNAKWPVVKQQRAALTTVVPSPVLLALMGDAVTIYIDDAWEKEEDDGGEYYRARLDRVDEFDSLIKQAAKEIVRQTPRILGRSS
jgi:hypothetical protein